MNKKTLNDVWFTLEDSTQYVNLGVQINGELNIIQVNFIRNSANWGVVIVDPDGKTYTVLNQLKNSEMAKTFRINGSNSSYGLYVRRGVTAGNYAVRWTETVRK